MIQDSELLLRRRSSLEEEVAAYQRDIDRLKGNIWEVNRALDKLRLSALHQALRERGLGVCSRCISFARRSDEQEQLAIHPLYELTYLFTGTFLSHQSMAEEGWNQSCSVVVTCKKDATSLGINSVQPNTKGLLIYSEAYPIEGRLVTVFNRVDISDRPIRRSYREGIYNYFGLEYPRVETFFTTFANPDVPIDEV